MARYAVEHIWEGKQEYFLIRDHQSWQMVLLPSKYLTHLIRANRSPNTVGRRAKSIRFYLEYLDEKEMELSQVAELEFQEQYEHYVGFLHWLKAEEQTMKKKQVLAVSSALMIGTTTALTGLPTPVMAQENTEVVQEAVVEENKTEQVPVEQKTENAEVQENITDKEQEETAENAETLKEESTKQETPATPEKEVVTEDKTVEASKNTEVKAGSIAIDETHFPDKVFREQIIAEFDKDGDSVLSVDEISKAQFLNLHGMKTISSLEGIQYLTNLQSLDVSTTSVSDLSPVKNSSLKRLDCRSSKVGSVDLTRYPNLEAFVCDNTSINSLDVSKNEKLNTLFADSTSISKLDVTNNPNLEQLTCGNTGLTELDVTHNPQLATLHIGDTGIEDYVTVGEMSSTTLEHCIRYSGAEEKELSMCFNFHHLKVDYKDGNKWELMEPDYMELKVIFEKWQMGMQRGNAWNALFWCNHDQPRIVSRFGNEGEYWKESAKMLAGMIHLMRGTPYIYQGEEIGMTNPHYTSIEQYADVESRNYYEILLNEGKTKEEALEILAARSRDNSRTPMQWTDERYCGFSDTKPWIPVSDNFEKINVKKQKQDRDSILEFYKKLIMLRKEKEVIARGNIEFMEVENAGVLAYTRCLDKQKLLVCCNFRDVESQMEFTQEWKSGRKILGNYEENHKNNYKVLTLRPYEIIVLEKGEE